VVTRADIVAGIRSLGVRPSDLVIAHSSYKSFGPSGVEGGPRTVAEALVESVSPGGSAFLPTFTYGRDVFDAATSPSHDGVITEMFRLMPGARRSRHPTHSVAGVGPDAATIIAGHDRAQPFGVGSPVWRLWERNAWVLLIGVGHFANSMAHVAEELLNMPYLDRTREAQVMRNGKTETVTVRRPGCSDAWDAVLALPLRARTVETMVGESRLQLMRARDVVDVTTELLRRDPRALLCARPECDACVQARVLLG
jgi:aminoglycoside N3'-acetyltransferase